MNEKIPTYFQRRPVYVCFLAETSDGSIIDFRRMRLESHMTFIPDSDVDIVLVQTSFMTLRKYCLLQS